MTVPHGVVTPYDRKLVEADGFTFFDGTTCGAYSESKTWRSFFGEITAWRDFFRGERFPPRLRETTDF